MKTFINLFALAFVINLIYPAYADTRDKIRLEADYISACQYNPSDPSDPTYPSRGAINNIQGDPTWVVPGENAMAILGLITASEILNEPLYMERANLSADYLVSIQDAADGAWYNQYSYTDIIDHAKSSAQTAGVIIALNKLEYRHDRYESIKKGAQFLISCQDTANIGGNDHGLAGGGKDSNGNYHRWRWTHDNSYAYWALKAAEFWAVIENEIPFANECAHSASRILEGINTYLYNPGTGIWHVVIDESGISQGNPDLPNNRDLPNWISYAPQMLDLPVTGVNLPGVGEWIHNSFQQPDGSCISYSAEAGGLKTRKYPGYSFQAYLCWIDLGQNIRADSALSWAESSGLWQTTPDTNTVTGGWIDWVEQYPEPGRTADWWLRFIDTSFYSIACWNGGYDFRFSPWILNLDIPYHEKEQGHYGGPASCKMILDFIREDSILTQDELYNYGIVNNHTDNTGILEIDLQGMERTLNNYRPSGYNFAVRAMPTLAESMRDICHWMDYEVPGTVIQNVPAAVPVFGGYSNWVTVRGAAASYDPSENNDFTVFGFWINDPNIAGIGRDSYKTARECELTYFLPLNTGDPWNGRYAAVSEPPFIPNEKRIFIAKNKTGKFAKEILNLLKIKENYPWLSKKIDNKIPRINWKNLIDPYLLGCGSFKTSLEGGASKSPIKVKRIDKKNGDYYLVPFYKNSLTSAVLIIDANKGYFKEASWTDNPVRYLPVTREKAIRKVVKLTKTPVNIHSELVWKPQKKSPSPYHPFWKITINPVTTNRKAGRIKTYFVYQDGSIENN